MRILGQLANLRARFIAAITLASVVMVPATLVPGSTLMTQAAAAPVPICQTTPYLPTADAATATITFGAAISCDQLMPWIDIYANLVDNQQVANPIESHAASGCDNARRCYVVASVPWVAVPDKCFVTEAVSYQWEPPPVPSVDPGPGYTYAVSTPVCPGIN